MSGTSLPTGGAAAASVAPQRNAAARPHSSRDMRFTMIPFVMAWSSVEACPQVPGRDGSIRPPLLGDLVHALRTRCLAQAVMALDRPDDREVAHRQHVGTLE